MKYPKSEEGEAIRINLDTDDWHFACCDCGLVHIMQFHHIKENIWDFALFRKNRATGQLRRHNYGDLTLLDPNKYK